MEIYLLVAEVSAYCMQSIVSDMNNNYTVCLARWLKKVFTQRLTGCCQKLSAGQLPTRNCEPDAHMQSKYHPLPSYNVSPGCWAVARKSTPPGQRIKVFKTTSNGQSSLNWTVITNWCSRPSAVYIRRFRCAHVNVTKTPVRVVCVHIIYSV